MAVDPVAVWIARGALAAVFAAAALHKWRDREGFAAALRAHRLLPDAAVPATALALAVAETAVVAGLVAPGPTARLAAGTALALLALYSGAIAVNLARGRRDLDCGCSARPRPVSPALLARNAALAVAAALIGLPVSPRPWVWVDGLTLVAALAALALLALATPSLAGRPGTPARHGSSA